MLTEYSKPSKDVARHTAMLIEQNGVLLARQSKITAVLREGRRRSQCIVCESLLADSSAFEHRGIPYCICSACGHVQCALEAPAQYPYQEQNFSEIYPPLDVTAYADRTSRIYVPKLDWALRAANAAGLGDLRTRRWVELGCGSGNFLSALRTSGTAHVGGLEVEPALVEQSRAMLGAGVVNGFKGSLADAVRQNPADIYVAWFVLEHCFETAKFLDALREQKPGTVFLFSVPTFGLAALLEGAFGTHYARSLDSVLHLQLFSDRSIRHAMTRAGYEIKAEWLFGQDADDLYRALITRLGSVESLRSELERLAGSLSEIQQSVDRARLSDSRHILAVRS